MASTWQQPGDVVEVEVEGLGRLSNTIVVGRTPSKDLYPSTVEEKKS